MNKYQVSVDNIGIVYDGNSRVEAVRTYGEYKRQSKADYGRAAGEGVVLFRDGEPMVGYDYLGVQNDFAD